MRSTEAADRHLQRQLAGADRKLGPTLVTYEIEQAGDAVKLTVTHEGFVEGGKLLGSISKGWPAILSGLKSLLETGEVLAIPPAALGKEQYVQG